jgi:hypothetical protein
MHDSLRKQGKSNFPAVFLLCGIGLLASPLRAEVVSDWNATAVTVVNDPTLGSQGRQIPYLSMVHAAIYDAVNGIDRRYSVLGVTPASDTRGASKEAAAASAAYHLLLELFPGQQSVLDAAYANSLSKIRDGNAKTKGIAIGQEVATAWIVLRDGDGRDSPAPPYVPGTDPGDYQLTGPPPILTWLPGMRPFTLKYVSQFRAYGPPDLTSNQYARDLNLVKSLGSAASTERTAEETEIALFHTENPNIFWWRNFRDLAAAKRLGTTESARLFALLVIGQGDAVQACFDSKYYFNFWRPQTAVPAADLDDNPATDADPAWSPLAPTPPHPEYPAAHACVAGLTAEILEHFFGKKHFVMTFTSTVPGSVPHTFHSTHDLVEEIIMARVYGGMHFATSGVHGVVLGRKVGQWITSRYFLPVKRSK